MTCYFFNCEFYNDFKRFSHFIILRENYILIHQDQFTCNCMQFIRYSLLSNIRCNNILAAFLSQEKRKSHNHQFMYQMANEKKNRQMHSPHNGQRKFNFNFMGYRATARIFFITLSIISNFTIDNYGKNQRTFVHY